MATNIHKRTFIVLLLLSLITLGKVFHAELGTGLLSTRITHHTTQDGVLSQTLAEELIFNYTDSFSESTLHFSCYNLNLTSYNELTLNFIIQGDQSSKAGIEVSFFIGSSQIDFLIEKIHQQPTTYSLTNGFTFDSPSLDDYDLTVTFAGQALYGDNGALIIFANSTFTNLELVELSETDQAFGVSPDTLLFEGNIMGLKGASAFTAFNNSFNSSFIFDLTVGFHVSDFESFTSELIILLNATEVGRSSFTENFFNEINFQFEIASGINSIKLIFQVEVCSDIIEINSFDVFGKAVENTLSSDIFHQFSWTDGIDETIDLSNFKPVSLENEFKLNISLFGSFDGTLVIEGIDYELFSGTEKIASGSVGISDQDGEIQLISILSYTDSYQDELLLKFSSDSSGSGIITIYNSTSIEIEEISHINTLKYIKYLETETTFATPEYGAITKRYTDVVYIENSSLPFQLEYLMILSSPDTSFQSIALTIKINGVSTISKSIMDLGDVHVVEELTLSEGFNQIDFSLSILGRGSTLTIENMRYTLEQGYNDTNNPLLPDNEGLDIPFFQLPKNIFLGVFVLFDVWLVMGIMLRIYKGRKVRKKTQVENDEYILEIIQLTQEK